MASDDPTRCANCTFVALDIFPKMLRDILSDTNISPHDLYDMVIHDIHCDFILNSDEIGNLRTLHENGFTELEFSLMYRIMKKLSIVDPPTRNWGANPLEHETTLGDDIERIRSARHNLIHQFKANISEQSYIEFFDNIILVSRRLDEHLKKPKGKGYENMIQAYKLPSLDNKEKDKMLDDTKSEAYRKRKC